eukprot:ANDGO_02273.mRNA.1 hypothetical protein
MDTLFEASRKFSDLQQHRDVLEQNAQTCRSVMAQVDRMKERLQLTFLLSCLQDVTLLEIEESVESFSHQTAPASIQECTFVGIAMLRCAETIAAPIHPSVVIRFRSLLRKLSIKSLSPAHVACVLVASRAMCPHLVDDLLDLAAVPVDTGTTRSVDPVLFGYYGGVCSCSLLDWPRAFVLFASGFCVPAKCMNSVMLECIKKFCLVSLIRFGELPSWFLSRIPSQNSSLEHGSFHGRMGIHGGLQSAGHIGSGRQPGPSSRRDSGSEAVPMMRHIRSLIPDYLAFCEQFSSQEFGPGSRKVLEETANKISSIDPDMVALVSICMDEYALRRIQGLSHTYSRLQVSDAARLADCSEDCIRSTVCSYLHRSKDIPVFSTSTQSISFIDSLRCHNDAGVIVLLQERIQLHQRQAEVVLKEVE